MPRSDVVIFAFHILAASFPARLYPLLQALRVQDSTVPSHTPFAGRTAPRPEPRKTMRYCVASCIIIWDEKTRSIY